MDDAPEIILLDKPKGVTSTDLLRILQKLYSMKKEGHVRTLTFSLPKRKAEGTSKGVEVTLTPELDACFEYYSAHNPTTKKLVCGHAGTLDPNATGLMIIGVGAGTKRLKEYVGLSKTYEAEILLGVRTDSGDITGNIVEEHRPLDISKEDIISALEGMVGVLRLPVSAFSAVKRGGQPLYKKAHKGEDVGTLPLRDMEVHSAQYVGQEYSESGVIVQVRFVVASGVYIRSLAEELGRKLGCSATLKNLRRTKVGDFHVEDAERLEN